MDTTVPPTLAAVRTARAAANGCPEPEEFSSPGRGPDGTLLPVSERHWSWKTEDTLTFGERLLDELDGERTVLTMEQHRKICAIKNGDEISKLLHADLGNALNPDLKAAHDTFGSLVEHDLSIPQMIMALRFYVIAQSMLSLDDIRRTLASQKLSKADQLSYRRMEHATIHDIRNAVLKVETLAKRLKWTDYLYKDRRLLKREKAEAAKAAPVATGVAPTLE